MIVDLLRNDLSRVCDPDSVQVPELCRLERYEYVQHLVSVVQGRLAAGKSVWDLFRAAGPADRLQARRSCARWKSLLSSNALHVVPTVAR